MTGFIVIIALSNRYKRLFRNAEATAPERSIIPKEHGIRKSLVFGKLLREGIICQVNNERYYLDKQRDAAISRKRHTILKVLLVILVLACMIGTLME